MLPQVSWESRFSAYAPSIACALKPFRKDIVLAPRLCNLDACLSTTISWIGVGEPRIFSLEAVSRQIEALRKTRGVKRLTAALPEGTPLDDSLCLTYRPSLCVLLERRDREAWPMVQALLRKTLDEVLWKPLVRNLQSRLKPVLGAERTGLVCDLVRATLWDLLLFSIMAILVGDRELAERLQAHAAIWAAGNFPILIDAASHPLVLVAR